MLRNFDRFEVGHYYVYTGSKTERKWSSSGNMDFVLKHEILQCSKSFKNDSASADFKENERGNTVWNWSDGFDNWVEVESPDAVFEEGDTVLGYKKQCKSWERILLEGCALTIDKKRNGYDNVTYSYYILKRKTKENKVKQEETVVWKDNPFKKYIRKKKYLTFSKKKKHTN